MRTWASPRSYTSKEGTHLQAYRLQVRAGGKHGAPAGTYLVIRLDDPKVAFLRALVGPMSAERASEMLEQATPDGLIDLLMQGMEKSMDLAPPAAGTPLH